MLPTPAGRWPFPTLSLRPLCSAGARTHTPPRSLAALVHSFTKDTGLHPREKGSAHGFDPAKAASARSRSSRLQSFDHLRAPALARPPDCSDRSTHAPGRRALHTTHRPAGHPDWDVASLHVRHGQLTWLDSHQLGRSLVGCSLPHTAHGHTDGRPRRARAPRAAGSACARMGLRAHGSAVVNASSTARSSSRACSDVRRTCPAPAGARRCLATRRPAGERISRASSPERARTVTFWPTRPGGTL